MLLTRRGIIPSWTYISLQKTANFSCVPDVSSKVKSSKNSLINLLKYFSSMRAALVYSVREGCKREERV